MKHLMGGYGLRSWIKVHFKIHILLLVVVLLGLMGICPQSLDITAVHAEAVPHLQHPHRNNISSEYCYDVSDCSGALVPDDSVKPKPVLNPSHVEFKLLHSWVRSPKNSPHFVGRKPPGEPKFHLLFEVFTE